MFNGKTWSIFNDYDFTVVVFLKDYNDKPDFDEEAGHLHGNLLGNLELLLKSFRSILHECRF